MSITIRGPCLDNGFEDLKECLYSCLFKSISKQGPHINQEKLNMNWVLDNIKESQIWICLIKVMW